MTCAQKRGFLTWLRRVFVGSAFCKALERNERAAKELDRAVREVLEQ